MLCRGDVSGCVGASDMGCIVRPAEKAVQSPSREIAIAAYKLTEAMLDERAEIQ